MKDQKKAKWILGSSGVILSALMLSQMNGVTESENANAVEQTIAPLQEENMSEREKELVSLDWTNFEIVTMNQQQSVVQSDRKTRKS